MAFSSNGRTWFVTLKTTFTMYFIDIGTIRRFFNPIAIEDISQIYEGVDRYSGKLNKGDPEARSQLYTVYITLVLGTVHQLLVLAFVPDLRSPRLSIILFDVNYMLGLDRLLMFFFALNNLVTFYMIRVVYQVLPTALIGRILGDVLIRDCRDFLRGHPFDHSLVGYFVRLLKFLLLPLCKLASNYFQKFHQNAVLDFFLLFIYIWIGRSFWQLQSLESIVWLDIVLGLLCLLVCITLFNTVLCL